MAKMEKESDAQDDEILQGITGKESFAEYLKKVDQNVKKHFKNKKKRKKNKKQ